ncbi:glycoside hydrolase family 2 TIM barrel-domain containing protein [Pelagicoccus mobilis]|uniref:DUF4982 domain-containing protein n=1 Tax=Pelagicoccus mobilis TaxID=415221 RepID=A0A934S1U5_9BACT|nr:glycoside hydrolase family 2 TIM barrel-domain containing protein [Pelagicoccus mobilis]MBK1879615.1 DUF4982 domain-containing protein [Pelagicoccus mobilis]
MKALKLALLAFAATVAAHASSQLTREADFNFGWKFHLQGESEKLGPKMPLDDGDWRDVRLPHDWSVEHSFSEEWEGNTGYLPGGIGWYQKHFPTPTNNDGKRTFVLFDGVYNNAKFWLNGVELGENPYGYSPVYFDLTDLLAKPGQENILTVHVDHSRYADARWYTGSGIYRKVKLITVNELHIPIWGTYVTTPRISDQEATVQIETKVANTSTKKAAFTLSTSIVDANGQIVAETSERLKLERGAQEAFTQSLAVAQPALWDTENPNLYTAVSTLSQNGKTIDKYTTPFGIRSLRFAAKEGFFLNGKPTLVKGVCLHHDGGLVGAAVPEGVWRRRLEELKAGGVNAIRLSHNPFSQEFLDLCDELGLLVQNELFDEWDYAKDKRQNYHDRHDDYITRGYVEHFQEWAYSDLERTMLRDRNHPSVFQWSIGNEIEWTYLHYRYVTGFWKDPNDPQNSGKYWGSKPIFSPEELKKRYDASPKGEYILAETAKKLNDWVKKFDTTRPTTANLVVPHVSMVSGYADAVDIVGFSYRNMELSWSEHHFPHKQVTINECPGTWDDWKHVLENPGVFSMYMWTAIAYMGESYQKWPQKHWYGDMLNLAGFRNPGWNYFKSIWVDEPHISIATKPVKGSPFKLDEHSGQPVAKSRNAYKWETSVPNTHWNYQPGEQIIVEVCSNYSIVELFINGRSLGSRSMSESPDRLFRWALPFEEGTLTAKASLAGTAVEAQLSTASTPVKASLTADKTTLAADGYDVSHLVVQLVDENGLPVKTDDREVVFEIEGDVRLLGVDTGAQTNVQDFQSNRIVTDQGRALLIVQSYRDAGSARITATSKGLASQTVVLTIE